MVSTTPSTQRSPFQRHSTFISTPTAAAATSALDSFSIDPILSPFLSDSFSPASFSSAALSSGSPASTAEHLHHAIRLLESQLRSEVLSRHSDLLTQLSSLRHAHAALSTVRSAVSSLHSSVRRARSEISDPHAAVLSKSSQLSNLHLTADLLHHAVRALRLSRKLRDLAESKLDLAKAAQIYADILRMCAEHDLAGIHAVDEELAWVRQIGEQLRGEAIGVLERGMEGLNQAEVGTGLQVFYNLGELKETVEQVVGKYKGSGVKSVGAALDMKAISGTGGGGFGPGGIRGGATPQIGGGARARDALWQRMGSCLDQMHSIVIAVWHLQRVLSKKRDPFTHVLLLDEVLKEDDALLATRVWEAIVKAFMSQMKSAFSASSFVKEIFTSGYPKLFSMIENLLERISRDTEVKGVFPAISLDGKEQMVEAIKIFQTSFLAQCLGRLSDIVNNVFPVSSRGSVPSKEQVSRIISRIQEELEAVKFNGHLTLLVLREIGKALLLLAQRAEYQISAGHEARQVTGPATPAQVKNFALCQHLQEIHIHVSSMVAGLPTIAAEVLLPPLGALYGVAHDAVTPVFKAMIDQLESCILQIHEQNFGAIGADASMDYNSSPYMEELQKSILHFQKDFLSKLLPSANTAVAGTETICTQLLRDMASRTLMLFIRHASLVRPLSESGKLRMARDMAELELTVGQHLFPVEQLGAPYRALRAFRPLIFLDTSQLGTSPLLQDLPPSIILHHLYSRGPDELQSPIQRNKLTPVQYSLWLDSQGEDQIWKGIKATLDDYAARVGSRGDKEFSPVYPLMLQLGSSLSENASAPEKR